MKYNFPKMTRANTGLGPNPIVGGKGGLRGGSGGAPISFTASAQGLVSGQSIMLDTGTLQSGFRTPYFIDEIRMQIVSDEYDQGPDVGMVGTWGGIGGNLRVQFQTGNRQFSKKPVPMGLYAPVFSPEDFGSLPAGLNGVTPTLRSYCNVRWPLPKPLWMAPGDVIQAVFDYLPLNQLGAPQPDVTVNVTYVGRTIAPGTAAPDTRQIPWVSFFEKLSDDAYLTTTEEFRNPFTYPMIVQRFTERTYSEAPAIGGLEEQLSNGQLPAMLDSNNQFISMKLEDSLGYAIVKDFAPVGLVFDTSRHAWTFSRSLGAREQFNLTLRTDDVNGAAAVPGPGWHTLVGMVGYRDEVRE